MAFVAAVGAGLLISWPWFAAGDKQKAENIRLKRKIKLLWTLIVVLLFILLSIISYSVYINTFMDDISDALNEMETINNTLSVANELIEKNEEYITFHMKYTELPQFQFDFIHILNENNIADIKELRSFDNDKLDEIWKKTSDRMYERYFDSLKGIPPPICNDKCFNYDESINNNKCTTNCECASIRQCIGGKCKGKSTYFDNPSCDIKKGEYIKLLKKYELEHIWPILNNNGYNSTSIILSITQQMLQKINIQNADTLIFGNLQNELRKQKESFISKLLNHPITGFCQENIESITAIITLIGTIPVISSFIDKYKKWFPNPK